MATVYAYRSDLQSVHVGAGCGKEHKRKGEERFAVSCPACEPELLRLGWTYQPEYTMLTDVEQAEAARVKELTDLNIGMFTQALASLAEKEAKAQAGKRG